ncbi:MAG: hypothetical protein WAK93_14450 [Solirubrobacteraceae bacterium]
MVVSLSVAWRLAFAVVLGVAIFVSVFAQAPRRRIAPSELRRLVLSALILYAVGWLATHTRHPALAALVYATGISVATLAAWLSRGRDQDEPPGDDEPADEPPPPDPDGVPRFDWARFEREFRDWAQRPREPLGR